MPALATQRRWTGLVGAACLLAGLIAVPRPAWADAAAAPRDSEACALPAPGDIVASMILGDAAQELSRGDSSSAGMDPGAELALPFLEALGFWTKVASESCAGGAGSGPRTPRPGVGAPSPSAADDEAQDAAVWSRTGQTPRPVDSEIP